MRSRYGATPEELEQLYRSKFPVYLRVATAICGEAEAGRDSVQAAFVSALRHRRSFRADGSLEAWLWTIVVREARQIARTAPFVSLDEVSEASNGNGIGYGNGESAGVRAFISALPARQREAVFLRYFSDLDYRTIARVLDVEPGTVSATLSAAHQTLRKKLEARTR